TGAVNPDLLAPPSPSLGEGGWGGEGKAVALPAVEQRLSQDGRFTYLGGRAPLDAPLQARARSLAERAVCPVPGLAGYFGVDLVLGDSADGRDDTIIEINPRMTTSYVGLRKLARGNLMQTLLRLAVGEPPDLMEWHAKEVRFHPDGR